MLRMISDFLVSHHLFNLFVLFLYVWLVQKISCFKEDLYVLTQNGQTFNEHYANESEYGEHIEVEVLHMLRILFPRVEVNVVGCLRRRI